MCLLIIICLICPIYGFNQSAKFGSALCSKFFMKKQFVLESPGYPNNYPSNMDCSYFIKGPICEASFNFQFLDFHLEYSSGCVKDRLEIDYQDALCGSKSGIKTYFTGKGSLMLRFRSDEKGSERGFRILITRQPCKNEHFINPDDEKTKNCCSSINSKHFQIMSPGFPYSANIKQDCVYQVLKSSENVCRLKINVQFFYLGQSTDCLEEYLKIDEKYLCGCKTDLKIISSFNDDSLKIIHFKTASGLVNKGFHSGFVLEVIQDECPRFSRTLTLPILKHYYFFGDFMKFIPYSNEQIIRDEEASKATFLLHTSNMEIISQPAHFFHDDDESYCLKWNENQLNFLYKKKDNINLVCGRNQIAVKDDDEPIRQCIELSYIRGTIKSPGYPFYYPANLNVCYRFIRQPGHCLIKLYMNDFNVEFAHNCDKDHLEFENQYRYCGTSLLNRISTINLNNRNEAIVNFKTDSFCCGRGFFGIYEQIACQDQMPMSRYPINPTLPSRIPCDRIVREKQFILEISDRNFRICNFQINKFRSDVCKIRLYLEYFNLFCGLESILIDGKLYCGQLNGKSITLHLNQANFLITYRRLSPNYKITEGGRKLLIRGLQIMDCSNFQVPPERLIVREKAYLEGKSTN